MITGTHIPLYCSPGKTRTFEKTSSSAVSFNEMNRIIVEELESCFFAILMLLEWFILNQVPLR
jgi:hypothetical protein